MEQGLALNEGGLVDKTQHSAGIEQSAAFMGRAASDVVEPSAIDVTAFSVAFRRERQEGDGGLIGVEIFVVQSRCRIVHSHEIGDDDGDVNGNDYGESQVVVSKSEPGSTGLQGGNSFTAIFMLSEN